MEHAISMFYDDSRGVAQPGSATVLGTVGREFESRRPDHANKGSDWFHSQSTRRALRKKSSFLAGTRRLGFFASGNSSPGKWNSSPRLQVGSS